MTRRARTVKPEILEDEVTAGLSDMAFRIFNACIVLSDDYGRFRAGPAYLMSHIYWSRTVVVDDFLLAMRELDTLILFYEVKGQRYGMIRNWSKHQRVDKPGQPRIPPPIENVGECADNSEQMPIDVGKIRECPEPVAPGCSQDSRLNGRERKGKEIEKKGAPHSATTGAEEVWSHYVQVLAKHRPRRRPTRLPDEERKLIAARLRDGLTVDDLKRACEGLFRSAHHLGNNDRDTEYLELKYALRVPQRFIAMVDDWPPEQTSSVRPTELVDPALVEQTLKLAGAL